MYKLSIDSEMTESEAWSYIERQATKRMCHFYGIYRRKNGEDVKIECNRSSLSLIQSNKKV